MHRESTAGEAAPEMRMVPGGTRSEVGPDDPVPVRLVAKVAAGVAGGAPSRLAHNW
jgi:hypothetical protein